MVEVAVGKINIGSSLNIDIIFYVVAAFEHVVAIAFGIMYVGSSRTIVIILYVAPAFERVLALRFVRNLFVRVPLSSYFFRVNCVTFPMLHV